MTSDTPDRDPLLDRLAEVWTAQDPLPDGLVDRAIAAVRAAVGDDGPDDLDLDLELMVLLDRSEELAGTRAGAGPVTLQFAGDELQLLLRVTPVSPTRCRVDAWLTPEHGWSVTVVQGRRHTAPVVAGPGRFEFPDLARGATRLVVAATDDVATTARVLGTGPFDL